MNISEEKSRLRKEIKQKRLKMTESDIQVKVILSVIRLLTVSFTKKASVFIVIWQFKMRLI